MHRGRGELGVGSGSIPMGGSCPDTIGREILPPGSMNNE